MSRLKQMVRQIRGARALRTMLATVGLLALLGGNAGAGCSSAGKVSSIDVPMEYKPRSVDGPVLRVPTGEPLKLFVSPTVDKRSDPQTIGENNQDEIAIPVYAAGKTPADFITEVLKQELTAAGLEITDNVSGQQRQIDSELLQFKVTEGGTYKAIVQLRIKVIDATGAVLWQGVGAGDGSNFGKSKSAVNYQETFSDATREAIIKVMADPKFMEAVSGKQ